MRGDAKFKFKRANHMQASVSIQIQTSQWTHLIPGSPESGNNTVAQPTDDGKSRVEIINLNTTQSDFDHLFDNKSSPRRCILFQNLIHSPISFPIHQVPKLIQFIFFFS